MLGCVAFLVKVRPCGARSESESDSESGKEGKVGSWFQCFQFSAFSSVKFELSEAEGLDSGEGGFDGVFAASNDEC